MTTERFLVTGALGCIGTWIVFNLIQENHSPVVLDLAQNTHRWQLLMSTDQIERVQIVKGDITNLEAVERVIKDYGITNIIHLAALQLPFCKADPTLGAMVNVVGTVNIFEAAKQADIKRLVYASSTAVYGRSEEYPKGKLVHDAELKPRSHYGVYKEANEGTARIYWYDDGISSIGLRPYVVYGAGRDQGMTSTPTKAMLAAAAGRPYHISFGGKFCFQYADDIAKTFIQSTRVPFDGANVYNNGGGSVSMAQVITEIENNAPEIRGKITYGPTQLPFPEDVDNSNLQAVLGPLPETPLARGVEETINVFRKGLTAGYLTADHL
jgi:UDP-glucuronate 4-epimerase